MLDWKTQSAAAAPDASIRSEANGILVGGAIATEFGWRPIEAVCCGDMVLTFDNGFRPIVGVRRVCLWNGRDVCPDALVPMVIEANVLDNTRDVRVLPEQGIMVESDAAEDYRGDPVAVLMPRSMQAYGFADRVTPNGPIEVIALEFEETEVIYGQCGLHYFVPKTGDLLAQTDSQLGYKILNTKETFEVLEELNSAHMNK
jgi:hypothetical protein